MSLIANVWTLGCKRKCPVPFVGSLFNLKMYPNTKIKFKAKFFKNKFTYPF